MKAIKNALLGLYGVIGLLISTFGLFRLPFAESLAKQYYRYAIGAVLFILLIIPLAFGLFLLYFDANNFKTEIIHYVKEHTQRDLVLEGNIKVTLFPKLGLDSGKMFLSQRNSAREFASVNNARLYIAWLPLLQRKLVFDHVEIDGAHANLIRYKNGTTNYDDLHISDETLSPLTFDIEGMRITNSSINWQDEMKWQRVALQDLKIETGRLADTVPGNLKASFQLNSELAHGDTRIELKSSLFFDRKAEHYEFADIEGVVKGTMAGFSNIDLNIKGGLDGYFAQQSLLLENIQASATANYGQRNISAKFLMPKIQYAKGILNGGDLSLDTTISQFDERWKMTMRIPTLEAANKIFKAAEIDTNFDFSGPGVMLQGKVSGPVSLDYESVPKIQANALSVDVSAKHPMIAGDFSAKGTGSMDVDFSNQKLNVDFSVKADDSDISGLIGLDDFNKPAYSMDLNIDHIDLDRYVSADWVKRYRNDATRLDFSGLKDLELNGNLHARSIRIAKLDITNLAAVIKVKQSELTIAPFTAKLYGGVMGANLNAEAMATPKITIKQNLKGVQVDSLLVDTSGTAKLTGKGDIRIDVSSEGNTIGELRNKINGVVSISLARGSFAGINLHSALIEGKDDLGASNKPQVHDARFSEKTDFSTLNMEFTFNDGTSHGDSFELHSPLFKILGEGDVFLDSGKVNYQLNATVATSTDRRREADLAAMKGVTVPVLVSGAYSSPSITLDFASASGDIVARKIAARAVAEQVEVKATNAKTDHSHAKGTARSKPSKSNKQ